MLWDLRLCCVHRPACEWTQRSWSPCEALPCPETTAWKPGEAAVSNRALAVCVSVP
jgi:hypothetical protein